MNKQQLLSPLINLLKIPSISTQEEHRKDMEKARLYLVDLFQSMGFKTKILKGKKHDAVFAQYTVHRSLPTVLIYCHYDVQPPDPLNEWNTPPFEPTVKGKELYGRGTTDNKGQIMIHIMTLKKLLEKNEKLQVNFKFIIEGEEEIGSPSITDIVRKYSKDLLNCDYMIVSDTEIPEKGQPSIDISLRGLLYTEVQIESGKHDLHSGQYGGAIDNPANVLANIIAKLKESSGKVAIPHFYDDIVPFSPKELKDFNKINITKDILIKEADVYGISNDETKYSLLERLWTRPTLDVNGIWGGYAGEGSKTIIPAKAGAKISMRLVPNQNSDKIYGHFVSFINKIAPKTVKIKFIRHADCLPYKAPTDNKVFNLMKQSLKKHFGKEPVFKGVGGSIGFVPIMAKALKVPVIMVGFDYSGSNIHAPNEHFSLSNYYKGIEVMTDFYANLAKS